MKELVKNLPNDKIITLKMFIGYNESQQTLILATKKKDSISVVVT